MDSVIEFSVNKADEFWNLLSPTNQLFNEPYELIFRGQSNSNWALKPSVFSDLIPV